MDASIALLEKILADSPGYASALSEIGSAYLRKARILKDRGEDPSDLLAGRSMPTPAAGDQPRKREGAHQSRADV